MAVKLITVLPDVSLACSGDGGDTRLARLGLTGSHSNVSEIQRYGYTLSTIIYMGYSAFMQYKKVPTTSSTAGSRVCGLC